MDFCGKVYVSKDIKTFSLTCILCEKDINEWEHFVYHIQSFHNSEEEDPLIPNESIKKDVINNMDIDASTENMNNDCFIKDEDEFQYDEQLSPAEVDSQPEDYTDTESDSKNIKISTKFNLSFHSRSTKTATFIELYKNCPCLWDPNDADYNNIHFQTESYEKIIQGMKIKCGVMLSQRALKATIQKLLKLYYRTFQLKSQSDSTIPSDYLKLFEMCSYLKVLDESSVNINREGESAKFLVFENINEATLTFIDAYACFPALYDPNHSDFSNITIRKQTFDDMLDKLKSNHNSILSEEIVYKSIYSLRQWYYNTKYRQKKFKQSLSDVEQQYVEKCCFLPPKAGKQFACEICGKWFRNDATLQVHLCKEHKIGDMPFKCTQCERSFEHNFRLQIHVQRSHQDKIHQCTFCERRFSIQVDLQRHIGTHTGEKPFVCELCGKAFRHKTQLGYHSNAIHTKTRAFKCTMCPKDFLKNGDLNDHLKAHLNIRDKICETCGKGFTSCHSLIRHRQIHSEVKKFVCKLCDAKFHQFVGLNSHMKRTHNIIKKQNHN